MRIEQVHELREAYRNWEQAKRSVEHLLDVLHSKHDGWNTEMRGQQSFRTTHKRLMCLNRLVEDNFVSDARLDKLMDICLRTILDDVQEELRKRASLAQRLGLELPS